MRRRVDGAVPAVAGDSSGATSGKSKRSCSSSEINRLRKETLNLRGVAELSILSMWQETAAMRETRKYSRRVNVFRSTPELRTSASMTGMF